jgi:tetratricopeptide (TPR) repeat protein
LQPIKGVEYRIEPDSDPVEKEVDGVTQRKYRFDGPQKNGIRLTATKMPEVLLQTSHDQEGEFWGVQIRPDLPVEQVAGNSRAIFLLDTSLSSNPDKFNAWLKLLESTLNNNRDSLKQFGVVFFSVDSHFWQDQYVDNTEQNVAKLMTTCEALALEGATDLYGAIEKVTQADWIYQAGQDEKANPTSGPDLFLLSDGAATWGETNLRLIDRQLRDHQLGSLFAYQTGYSGTAIAGLRFLAGQSGGAVFSVADEAEIKTASTAHRKRPWELESISAAGATDIMTAGRAQWVYPGQTITVVGRGEVADRIELKLNQSGESKSISITPTRVQSELASRLYGQVAVGQLESLGAKVFDVAASYARHFRVTGDSCSLLMLESEADYQRFDIKPEEDLFVIKTKSANELVAETLEKSANELADPKAQLLAWLQRLETMPGMEFKLETAFQLALEQIQIVAVSKPLDCSLTQRNELSKEYLAALQSPRLDYGLIAAEAKRRGATSVDDAIKVFSSLVEQNPGDMVVARDVAFTAMEMGRPAQAYHLLRNVAKARPYEGSVYPALGQCLTQLGQADLAIVYYEIALGGTFQRQGENFKQIVSAEYMHLLRRIVAGDLDSSVKDFATARLETLGKNLRFESANLLITMMWNTDQTDVDLHVIEPSGEECSYENKITRSGGQITSDITTGFGPEMYSNPTAPKGKYEIQVKYFGSDQNRTSLQNKVYLTIYREFGTADERITRRTIQMNRVGEKESVATIGVEK